MNKEKLSTYVLTVVLCWLLYKVITFFIYRRLMKRLKGADLDTFTRYLGEDYVFRFLSGDVRRYRWKKGLFVVKAGLDEQDRLTYNEVPRFDFFGLFTKIVFL